MVREDYNMAEKKTKEPNITYYKDFCGATASIKVNRTGTAVLTVCTNGIHHVSRHKNKNAAYQAWRRWCR